MTIHEQKDLSVADWIVLGLYFVICLGLGVSSKFFKKKKDDRETPESYFLAGRSMLWWAVGGSLFASNIGSEHFVGIAGSGAAAGIGVAAYEWHASWILLLLGFFFVPVYIRSKIYTMPEYLKSRFQSRYMRMYLTIISLISYVTTKIAVDLYAGGLFLKKAVGMNIYLSSAIILTFTAVYTLLGGLTAVIYTDVMQCTVMVIGALVLSVIGFAKVGGIDDLWSKYPLAIGKSYVQTLVVDYVNATVAPGDLGNFTTMPYNKTVWALVDMRNATSDCYAVEAYWGHMFRPLDDKEYPWLGIVFSLPVTGIWYWCTDQVIVQRTLGAKSINHARLGTVLAGFLKLLPLYIMVMPGMIARVLNPDLIGCPDRASCLKQCNNEYGCSNEAYPDLVLSILPVGLVGLMLAVMIAALMSSLSSAFNSSSTIFTMDIWRIFRPKASDREMVIVGRVVVVVLAGVGILWIPIVSQGHGGQLFKYLQTIQSYLAPPTCAVFLVGMLWPRLTEVGALTSMIFGLLLGIVRLICDVVWPEPHCGEVDERNFFVKLHFMFYALIMFGLCVLIMVVISFFTRPVPLEQLGALTWRTIDMPRYRLDEGERIVAADDGKGELMFMEKSEYRQVEGVALQAYAFSGQTSGSLKSSTASMSPFSMSRDAELEEIRAFEHQTPRTKWFVRGCAGAMMFALIFLWIWYR